LAADAQDAAHGRARDPDAGLVQAVVRPPFPAQLEDFGFDAQRIEFACRYCNAIFCDKVQHSFVARFAGEDLTDDIGEVAAVLIVRDRYCCRRGGNAVPGYAESRAPERRAQAGIARRRAKPESRTLRLEARARAMATWTWPCPTQLRALRVLLLLLFDLRLGTFERFSEVPNATAEGAAYFGQLAGSENEQCDNENDNELRYS
jgi:hypothetical protein